MDEALLAYRRAIAADPLERDAQPLYHAGQILMYQGQYEEAQAQRQRGNFSGSQCDVKCWGWFGFGWLEFFPEQNGETWICDYIYICTMMMMYHVSLGCSLYFIACNPIKLLGWCDARGKGLGGLVWEHFAG